MRRRDAGNRYNGVLNVAKPVGITSHDVVDQIRRDVGMRRVGHAGTLDPAAEGVLLLCLGSATRITDYLMDGVKVYQGTVRFGATSTTDDREGAITPVHLPPIRSSLIIQGAASGLVGEIDQIPPSFAAIKVGGRPMYQRARAGETVTVPPRRVRINRISVLSWNPPDAVIEVECSKGTYIRAIARDLGAALQTGAYLAALCRLSSGRYRLADSLSLDDIAQSAAAGYLDRLLIPLDEAIDTWPAIVLTEREFEQVMNGAPLAGLPLNSAPARSTGIRAYNRGGRIVALLAFRDKIGTWYPDKVFPPGEVDGLA